MKKVLLTTLSICVLSLTACNSNETVETLTTTASEMIISETSTEESVTESMSALEAIGNVSVEKELFDVKLTIPADFVGETTQEELEAEAKEKGYKATLNDDGSATYEMTKSQHKKMMDELTANLNQSLSEMIGSEHYPNFTDIKTNSDFTEFTIITQSEELDLAESFSVMGFYMYGGMYNIFNGTPVDNIHVDFINATTGETLTSSDSKEMNN